ncbi:MAG: hypothetical protein ACTHM5_20895 [Ginsengibacter sp.]
MVIKNLTDLSTEKNMLLNIVSRKIATSKYSSLNQDFDSNLKIDINNIALLVDAIETKIRKAEILFYSYFETANHAILCGNSATLPFVLQIEFIYAASVMRNEIYIDDKSIYRETVDMQFQSFILLIASLFENIVRLTEILIKKVIVHQPGDKYRPINTPLFNYKSYLDSLIRLGYRKMDYISNCFLSHNPFLSKYLLTINGLRNSFIHGFINNLSSDGFNYRVTNRFDTASFSMIDPVLNIDEFSREILFNGRRFYIDLMLAITNQLKHHTKKIPG